MVFFSDQYRLTSFTPLSVVVGRMVHAVHRCLLTVLTSESSAIVITQVLKCLATVIANVPYQRLRPGLLGSAVKQIRPYLSHRGELHHLAFVCCLSNCRFKKKHFVLLLSHNVQCSVFAVVCQAAFSALRLLVGESVLSEASPANEVAGAFRQLNVHDEGLMGFWAALGSSDSEFSDICCWLGGRKGVRPAKKT